MAEPRPINETRRNVKRSEVVAHRIAQAIANDGLGLGDRLPPENAVSTSTASAVRHFVKRSACWRSRGSSACVPGRAAGR